MRVDLNYALRQGAAGVSASRSQHKTRSTLVIVEVAIGLVLLFGAGLFLSSFVREERAPRGFDAPGALTFHVSLRGENYAKPEQQQRYFNSLLEQLRLVPGKPRGHARSGLPLTVRLAVSGTVNIAGRPPAHKYGTYVTIHAVAPNYFRGLGMRPSRDALLIARRPGLNERRDPEPQRRNRTLWRGGSPWQGLDFVAQPHRGVPPQPSVQIVGRRRKRAGVRGQRSAASGVSTFPSRNVPSVRICPGSSRCASRRAAWPDRDAAYSLDKDQPFLISRPWTTVLQTPFAVRASI